jgi:hypothetical protein
MKKLIDLLHTLLCDKRHISDILKINDRYLDCCYYYLENDIAGGSSMADHVKWHSNFEGFKIVMNLNNDAETEQFLKESIEISQKIRTVSASNEERLVFIKSLLPKT